MSKIECKLELNRDQIAIFLTEWFKNEKINWNYDPVARVIKENLKKNGHWKNLPRGKRDK